MFDVQSSTNHMRNIRRIASGTLGSMKSKAKKPVEPIPVKVTQLQLTIAAALRYYRDKAFPEGISDRGLSQLTGKSKADPGYVSDNSLRAWLYPGKKGRTTTFLREDGSLGKSGSAPTVDKLASLARHLNCEVWQLLHPEPAVADYIAEQYRQLQEARAAALEPRAKRNSPATVE